MVFALLMSFHSCVIMLLPRIVLIMFALFVLLVLLLLLSLSVLSRVVVFVCNIVSWLIVLFDCYCCCCSVHCCYC